LHLLGCGSSLTPLPPLLRGRRTAPFGRLEAALPLLLISGALLMPGFEATREHGLAVLLRRERTHVIGVSLVAALNAAEHAPVAILAAPVPTAQARRRVAARRNGDREHTVLDGEAGQALLSERWTPGREGAPERAAAARLLAELDPGEVFERDGPHAVPRQRLRRSADQVVALTTSSATALRARLATTNLVAHGAELRAEELSLAGREELRDAHVDAEHGPFCPDLRGGELDPQR
jgi:hypothetical protein